MNTRVCARIPLAKYAPQSHNHATSDVSRSAATAFMFSVYFVSQKGQR